MQNFAARSAVSSSNRIMRSFDENSFIKAVSFGSPRLTNRTIASKSVNSRPMLPGFFFSSAFSPSMSSLSLHSFTMTMWNSSKNGSCPAASRRSLAVGFFRRCRFISAHEGSSIPMILSSASCLVSSSAPVRRYDPRSFLSLVSFLKTRTAQYCRTK